MLRNLICALKRLKLCPQFRKSCPERRDTKTYQNKRENSCQRIRARCSNSSGDSVAIAITHPNQSNTQCNPQHCPNQLPDILIRSRTNGHSNGDRSGTGRQRQCKRVKGHGGEGSSTLWLTRRSALFLCRCVQSLPSSTKQNNPTCHSQNTNRYSEEIKNDVSGEQANQ